jgi:DNA-binding XRE family transcriptional regulator
MLATECLQLTKKIQRLRYFSPGGSQVIVLVTGSGGTSRTSRSPSSCTWTTPQKKRNSPSCLSAPPLDWEDLERELHAAGVSREEIDAGGRRLLAQARGHQLAETRKQFGLGQKQIAAAIGVSVARVSQIEHGEVTSFEVIARYVEALGGRLDLVADFGDRTIRLPVSDTATAA